MNISARFFDKKSNSDFLTMIVKVQKFSKPKRKGVRHMYNNKELVELAYSE